MDNTVSRTYNFTELYIMLFMIFVARLITQDISIETIFCVIFLIFTVTLDRVNKIITGCTITTICTVEIICHVVGWHKTEISVICMMIFIVIYMLREKFKYEAISNKFETAALIITFVLIIISSWLISSNMGLLGYTNVIRMFCYLTISKMEVSQIIISIGTLRINKVYTLVIAVLSIVLNILEKNILGLIIVAWTLLIVCGILFNDFVHVYKNRHNEGSKADIENK